MTARLLVAAAFLALSTVAADAVDPADVPLPPITPTEQYLVLTHDDATSSSKCIGNPITPICAVETVMAYDIRGNDDLC